MENRKGENQYLHSCIKLTQKVQRNGKFKCQCTVIKVMIYLNIFPSSNDDNERRQVRDGAAAEEAFIMPFKNMQIAS
jgi:hypothetical protein